MEQLVADLSPVLISTLTAIISACLIWIAAMVTKFIKNMNISETFKKDLVATNDQIRTSLKKIVTMGSENLRQKLADGKLTEKEIGEMQKNVYREVKAQIPDLEVRLEKHMTNGGKYVADSILGEIESGNKVTNL